MSFTSRIKKLERTLGVNAPERGVLALWAGTGGRLEASFSGRPGEALTRGQILELMTEPGVQQIHGVDVRLATGEAVAGDGARHPEQPEDFDAWLQEQMDVA